MLNYITTGKWRNISCHLALKLVVCSIDKNEKNQDNIGTKNREKITKTKKID